MQFSYTPLMSQYEVVLVPSHLVSYVKSIIQQYSFQPQGYIPSLESMGSNQHGIHDLLKSAVSISNPVVPMNMPHSVQQLIQHPVQQPIQQPIQQPVQQPVQQPIQQLVKQPVQELSKKIEINKSQTRFSDHTVCLNWMTGKCTDSRCIYDHFYSSIFKTQLCKFWESGTCKYKIEECRYAHGKNDIFNMKNQYTNYYKESSYSKDLYPKRSRSRSRERSFSTKPSYYVDKSPDKNVNY
jgi:hypothetical protein